MTEPTASPTPDRAAEQDQPLVTHGDPLLASATGSPQGDGTRHGLGARAGENGDATDEASAPADGDA